MNLRPAMQNLLGPGRSPRPGRPAPSGIYLGWGTKGPVRAGGEEHVLVIGPPRSGKTSRLLAFAVRSHTGPAVITSTKHDVIAMTADQRARLGRLWLWGPSGTVGLPDRVTELHWSPLVGCEVWDDAVQRTHALASAARPDQSSHDTHWVERAQALLAPLLHAAALSGNDLPTVMSWLHRRELVVPVSALRAKGSSRAADLLEGVAHTDARERSGIFSTADSLLAAYRTDAAMAGARSPNFDAEAFARSRDTVYLCAPAANQALHAPLVVALLDQVRSAVYRANPRPPMLFALDEVAQIAPLPDLASTIAEGGSQGLVVMACLQDLSQARARWGKAADGFLTLFTHKVVMNDVGDVETLKAISALAGEVDVKIRSSTVSHAFLRGQSSTTWSVRLQPRLPVDAVAHGQAGTALLISGTRLGRVWLPPLPAKLAFVGADRESG